MINYLDHEFELYSEDKFAYMDVLVCKKCSCYVVKNKKEYSDQNEQMFLFPDCRVLNLNCKDMMIKSIIE